MQDAIIKGNGNSRYLKTVAAALSLYPTYEDFLRALVAGNFPIDLNGINEAGWTQQGTPLNKANLLPDTLATSLGLPTTATVADALLGAAIYPLPKKIASYETAGSFTWTAPDLANGKAYKIGVLIIGGGASGMAGWNVANSSSKSFPGGSSGFSMSLVETVTPGSLHSLVVGAGGQRAVVTVNGTYKANNGGASSFDGATAEGGYHGSRSSSSSSSIANGAAPGDSGPGSFGGLGTVNENDNGNPFMCLNPFDGSRILGAGGGVSVPAVQDIGSATGNAYAGGKDPITTKGGGDGALKLQSSVSGNDADAAGCGGGAAATSASSGKSLTITSGAGADGAVYIYFLGVAD